LGVLLVIIAAGLGSRHPSCPGPVISYVGDVLWGALFFHLFRLVWPIAASVRLWLAAVVTTEAIELSQLWRTPWLENLRATRLGGLLLGHQFLLSDVVGVALGASAAAIGLEVSTRFRRDGS
jgi:Protein of unknown function (DUF2809)